MHSAAGRGGVLVRTSDYESRGPGFKLSCCIFEAMAITFTPCCRSSLGRINKYLAVSSGGYVNE